MTDLTTTHLKRLLEQATPSPWEYKLEDGYIMGDLVEILNGWIQTGDGETVLGAGLEINDDQELQNLALAALAPELAQEVIRLREELRDLRDQLKKKAEYHSKVELSTDPLDGIELEDNYAEDEISRILGDHDEH